MSDLVSGYTFEVVKISRAALGVEAGIPFDGTVRIEHDRNSVSASGLI
jgi:hypothetical protein